MLYYPELAAAATVVSVGLHQPQSSIHFSQDISPLPLSAISHTPSYRRDLVLAHDREDSRGFGYHKQKPDRTMQLAMPLDRRNHDNRPSRRSMDSSIVAALTLEELEDGELQETEHIPRHRVPPEDVIELPRHKNLSAHAPRDNETSLTRQNSRYSHDQNSQNILQQSSALRRSNRKRTQRSLLNIESQPPVITSPPPSNRRNNSSSRSTNSHGSSNDKSRSSKQQCSGNNRRYSRGASARKRRCTSGSQGSSSSSVVEDSIDSNLSFEVSIYTEGTAVRHKQKPQEPVQTCFICNKSIDGDIDAVNEHVDQCLAQSSGETAANETEEAPMIEYEWGGQTRVRATAMLEGGVIAAGLGFSASSTYKENDDEVDVDAEDEANFGAPQYTDNDLIFSGNNGSEKGSRSRNQPPNCPNTHLRRPSDPQWEQFAPSIDNSKDLPPPASEPLPSTPSSSVSASQLVIEALKERINQQEHLLKSIQKCLICLEPYENPCASINCWHVYCEKCWMRTLGTKKLCPQCLQITQPTDLRRIYL